jgi:undecaprenyl-diphosphatase
MRPAEPGFWETAALGLVHGPAELLPVSSSAHVGLLPWALGWRHAALPGAARKEVEVALHAGTALALAFAERRRPRWALLCAATIPPALAGFVLERPIQSRLGTPRSVAGGLLLGAAAMVAADRRASRRSDELARSPESAGIADGAVLGAAQALALVPGVSRSGATRAAARARGFGRAEAAALSREVALPVLAGAVVLKGVRLVRRRPPATTWPALGAGVAASAVSTWAALRAERAVTADAPLVAFAAYRTALAVAILAESRRRRRAVCHDRAR